MKYYKIAGLTVAMDSFGKTVEQATPYLSDAAESPDITVSSNWRAVKKRFPELTDESCEYISTGSSFYRQLVGFDGIMLHSSAVVMDGKAYLFTAPSGTGKSTHTALWIKEFADRAFILNDDKPALRLEDGVFYAYGTPWSGKTDKNVNCRVPIGGICILSRGAENKIERAEKKSAIFGIYSQTVRPKKTENIDKVFFLIEKLIEKVPVWQLYCNTESEAAHVSYSAMSAVSQKEDV